MAAQASLDQVPTPAAGSDPVLVYGARPAGTHVTAELRPAGRVIDTLPAGATVNTHPLTVTYDGDRFAVRTTPESIPADYLSTGGDVNIHILAQDGNGNVWTETTSAQAVMLDNGHAAWANADQGTATETPSKGFARALTGNTSGVNVGGLNSAGRGGNTETDERAARLCTGSVGRRYRVWARVGASWPVEGGTSHLSGRSNGGRYAAVEKFPRRPFTTSLVDVDGSWSVRFPRTRSQRVYRFQVAYRGHTGRFRDMYGICHVYRYWTPTIETGGSDTIRAHRPRYGICVPLPARTKWARSRSDGSPFSLSFGVGLPFLGISVGVSKNYSASHHTVAYFPAAKRSRMCGRGRAPSVAGRFMQRP